MCSAVGHQSCVRGSGMRRRFYCLAHQRRDAIGRHHAPAHPSAHGPAAAITNSSSSSGSSSSSSPVHHSQQRRVLYRRGHPLLHARSHGEEAGTLLCSHAALALSFSCLLICASCMRPSHRSTRAQHTLKERNTHPKPLCTPSLAYLKMRAFEYLDADFEARRQAALRRPFQRRKENRGFVL
jgi:hypothetical protein